MSACAKARRRERRAAWKNVCAYIEHRSAGVEAGDFAYWIHGSNEKFPEPIGCDEGTNFCQDCCQDKVDEIEERFPDIAERIGLCVDGGWGTDHDSRPYCHNCGTRLDGNPTSHCVSEEIDALTTYAMPTRGGDPRMWESLRWVLDSVDDEDQQARIGRVVRRTQRAQRCTV